MLPRKITPVVPPPIGLNPKLSAQNFYKHKEKGGESKDKKRSLAKKQHSQNQAPIKVYLDK